MAARFTLHRRQGFDVSKQIANVAVLYITIRGVRKSWIKIGAVFRCPLPQCGDEIRLGPTADSVLGVGRNVRRVKDAKRRFQGQAAAEPLTIDLFGGIIGYGMARRTAAD